MILKRFLVTSHVYCQSQSRLPWIEHLRGSRGNPQLISRKYVLTSAQNVQNMRDCLRIRQEFCKTGWCAAAGQIEPERREFRSGRGFTKEQWRSEEHCPRQGCWAGAKRSNTTLLTSKLSLHCAALDCNPKLSMNAIPCSQQLLKKC